LTTIKGLLKDLSDYRTARLWDCWTNRLSHYLGIRLKVGPHSQEGWFHYKWTGHFHHVFYTLLK